MQVFQAPAAVHELHGEPVEQFGMGRRLTLRAQIFRGGYEAGAEVGLPDSVHDGPRRRRSFSVYEPLGECESRWNGVGWLRVQERGHTTVNELGRLQEIPSSQDVRFAPIA